ncbi:MAG: hypothetical protein GEU74_13720 [Nitriliruptorales bacterium]|nr:hypothetical protein [Nitriliruptorales bacterium]
MSTVTSRAISVTSQERTGRPGERRLLAWLFIVLSAAFLIVQEGAVTGYDGATMFAVTESLVERGTVAVSPEFNTMPGRGGLEYSRYGLGLSLLAIPPYLAAKTIPVSSGAADKLLEGAVSLSMAFVTAALVVALYVLARRLRSNVGPALLVAVGGVIGTFVLPYGKEFFSEPLTALCLVVAIERLLAGRASASGLAMGAAVVTRTQNVLFAPVLVLVAWRRGGLPAAARTCAGMVPGAVVTLGYNLIRFGDPLTFGYEDVGFTTPLLNGVGGLLFNPWKSVLLFAPLVVLLPLALRYLWRHDRAAFVLLTANLGITFLVTAAWFAWHGGWSWGPRLLLPGLVPAFAAIAPWLVTTWRVRTAALLAVAGFAVSFPALIVPTQAQQLETPPVPPEAHFLDTQPLASPSVPRQWELIAPTTRYSLEHRYEGVDDGRNYLRYLSLWQLGVSRVYGSRGLAAALLVTALLAIIAGWSLLHLVRVARLFPTHTGGSFTAQEAAVGHSA